MPEPQPDNSLVVSHWAKLFEGIKITPSKFYEIIEHRLKNREVTDFAASSVNWHEGGVFSDKREYMRLNRGDMNYYICAAPYGSGFFVSSRLTTPKGGNVLGLVVMALILMGIIGYIMNMSFGLWGVGGTVLGTILIVLLLLNAKKLTFYKIDKTQMFQQAVHQSLMEAVDQMTKAAGIAPLSESERKPVMHELFR